MFGQTLKWPSIQLKCSSGLLRKLLRGITGSQKQRHISSIHVELLERWNVIRTSALRSCAFRIGAKVEIVFDTQPAPDLAAFGNFNQACFYCFVRANFDQSSNSIR